MDEYPRAMRSAALYTHVYNDHQMEICLIDSLQSAWGEGKRGRVKKKTRRRVLFVVQFPNVFRRRICLSMMWNKNRDDHYAACLVDQSFEVKMRPFFLSFSLQV